MSFLELISSFKSLKHHVHTHFVDTKNWWQAQQSSCLLLQRPKNPRRGMAVCTEAPWRGSTSRSDHPTFFRIPVPVLSTAFYIRYLYLHVRDSNALFCIQILKEFRVRISFFAFLLLIRVCFSYWTGCQMNEFFTYF